MKALRLPKARLMRCGVIDEVIKAYLGEEVCYE